MHPDFLATVGLVGSIASVVGLLLPATGWRAKLTHIAYGLAVTGLAAGLLYYRAQLDETRQIEREAQKQGQEEVAVRYNFTAAVVDGEDGWFVAYIEELPGAHGQGRTIEDAMVSVREAVELILQANREVTAKAFRGARVARRAPIMIDDSPLRRPGRGEA